jgi:hypothetical protein
MPPWEMKPPMSTDEHRSGKDVLGFVRPFLFFFISDFTFIVSGRRYPT